MNEANLGRSRVLNLLLKPAGWAMESRFRRLLHNPDRIVKAADVRSGQTVLEVGSGTGFFTPSAARLIGSSGKLIAMEPLSSYAERLREKAEVESLQNVEVVCRDALETGLANESVDRVLLFGVLPFPSLPLEKLLPEMHRVLKSEGILALWQFPADGWVPGSIGRSGMFSHLARNKGVHLFRRT